MTNRPARAPPAGCWRLTAGCSLRGWDHSAAGGLAAGLDADLGLGAIFVEHDHARGADNAFARDHHVASLLESLHEIVGESVLELQDVGDLIGKSRVRPRCADESRPVDRSLGGEAEV